MCTQRRIRRGGRKRMKGKRNLNKKKNNSGITLVALIINIIDGLNVCTLFYSHWNMWLLTAGEMASVRLSTTF